VHFRVIKRVVDQRTVTDTERLDGEPRVVELAAMLGGDRPDTRRSAESMLEAIG
jgi:DNA repair ATPase RecN